MPNKSNSFSSPIYQFPTLYNDIMWWKKDDITFWNSIINKNQFKSILEICCGTGRLGLPIIESQKNYYGLDLSESFIDFFKSKAKQLHYDTNKIICSNATNFDLNKKFDFIFIGFNSLAHLLTDQDVINCFNCIQNHMHNNSLFGIDIFMPSHELIFNNKSEKTDLMDFIDSRTSEKLNILESTHYNAKNEINQISWEFIDSQSKTQFTYNFDMRMFFPDTLNRLLIDSNFKIHHFYGDYQFHKFNEYSGKQIYLCSKQ